MANLMTRILLFVSSYAPLLVILWVRDDFGGARWSWVALAFAVVSVATLCVFLGIVRTCAPRALQVKQASARDGEALSYVVTYLLPFIGLNSGDVDDRISLAIFLGVLAVLYVSANLIHMNPMLNLFGYRLFEIEDEGGRAGTLICRRRTLRASTEVSVVSLADAVFLEHAPRRKVS